MKYRYGNCSDSVYTEGSVGTVTVYVIAFLVRYSIFGTLYRNDPALVTTFSSSIITAIISTKIEVETMSINK